MIDNKGGETFQDLLLRRIMNGKVDSAFIEKYFGKFAQAKLGMHKLSEFEQAILMNGVSGTDCSQIDFDLLSQEEFELIPFDSSTIFNKKTIEKFHPDDILERCKRFGLGLESLNLTGNGIHVAIVDQNCNYNEMDSNVVEFIGDENDSDHFHGKTVLSLLASRSCGIAKEAQVHFFAEPEDNLRLAHIKMLIDYRIRCIERIIRYNSSCNKNERIQAISGSWRLPENVFLKYDTLLRAQGTILVCANNFDEYFSCFVGRGENSIRFFSFSEQELRQLIGEFPEYEERIMLQSKKQKNVKIPVSRTCHQVGTNKGYKYLASYSTSWAIPQVVGLFVVFREKYRELTFQQFCDISNKTAIGNNRIINPIGINREIETLINATKEKKKAFERE